MSRPIDNAIIYELDANNCGIEETFHAITDNNWVQILNFFKGTPREARVINMINTRLTDQFPESFTDIRVTYIEHYSSWVFSTFYI